MMKKLKYLVFGLLSLFLSVSFGYCQVSFSSTSNRTRAGREVNISISSGQLICFTRNNSNLTNCQVNGVILNNLQSVCLINNTDSSMSVNASCNGLTSSRTIDYWIYNGNGSLCGSSSCPEVNTGEILSGYILESDINNLYCEEHGYCPIIDTGEAFSGMSTLFINQIEHQSAPLINITIPEEYNWDSSVDTGEFKLVISGTNVDHEYIDGIIRTQNSKPSSDDLTNIFSGLIPLFIPGLCIILLLHFIYLFIKKIF